MRRRYIAVLGFAITSLCAADGPQQDGSRPGSAGAPNAEPAGRAEDEKAIRTVVDRFARAFQDKDARAIAALFTEDGEAVDPQGGTIQGRAALEEHYSARFAERPGDKIEPTIESIKFLAPGVARDRPHPGSAVRRWNPHHRTIHRNSHQARRPMAPGQRS